MRLFPFDAVVFDLDGTLVATDSFWPDAARAGARQAFAELGLERAPPSAEAWMSIVGLPSDEGYQRLFPDLDARARDILRERCEEQEASLLKAGRAALLPGAAAALEELARRGVHLGIASNCTGSYLDAMLEGLGLARWIGAPRCLDSPGVACKADMVADLLETFGTRSAVMVGDRAGDRDAAWANGLPHVHLSRGYAEQGESVLCEAVIDGLDELVACLERRWSALEGIASRLPAGNGTIGVTGPPASGKTLFARDLARVLASRGEAPRVLALEDFRRSEAEAPVDGSDVETAFDLERFAAAAAGAPGVRLVVEGPFLAYPALRGALERCVHLFATPDVLLRRLTGRDGRDGARAIDVGLGRLERDGAFAARYPRLPLDLEVDASDALRPRVVGEPQAR